MRGLCYVELRLESPTLNISKSFFFRDQYKIPVNFPPTPPLAQHFA